MKQIYNPFLPSYEYIPDGEPHVFGDRVYLFGSHDRFGGDSFCMNDYVCWSAPTDDLKSWRFEGVIYRRTQDPLNADGSHALFAPDVCRGPDGRYYLYYALDFVSVISVAVSDTPAGRYQFYGHVHFPDGHVLSSRAGEPYAFDPAVLCEGGEVRLYMGYCQYPPRHLMEVPKTYTHAWVYRLESDMLTIRGEGIPIVPSFSNSAGTGFEGHEFFEAASIRKVEGRYCFIWSSYYGHELCYALAERPEGPFRFGGTIISNGDIGLFGIADENDCNGYIGNNHGSVEKIGGRWYVFYHRHTNGNSFSRRACAERIEVEKDGKIPQVEMTSCGLNGGPLEGAGRYPAYIACILKSGQGTMRGDIPKGGVHPYFTQDGADGETEANAHIANIKEGAVCGFKYFKPAGAHKISMEVRGCACGEFIVRDGRAELARVGVLCEGEARVFSAPFKEPQGEYALYFRYKGEGACDFMWFELE